MRNKGYWKLVGLIVLLIVIVSIIIGLWQL